MRLKAPRQPTVTYAGHTHDPACMLVVGVGLRTQASARDLQQLWQRVQQALQPPATGPQAAPDPLSLERQPHAVAALAHKTAHPALHQWLRGLNGRTAIIAVPASALPSQPVHTQSARMQNRYGTGSVAEASALWAASRLGGGKAACLLLPRLVASSGRATMAVACHAGIGLSFTTTALLETAV